MLRNPGSTSFMRVVIIDNFDSFTHNLAQAVGGLGAEALVVRNVLPASEVALLRPDRLILSPGPGTPDRSGHCAEVVARFSGRVPILGVCLGMQLLAMIGGGRIVRAPEPIHGRASSVDHDGLGVFEGLPTPLLVGRYHSLMVEPESLPECFVATAWSNAVLMGLRHRTHPTEGVQFHPESVLSPDGARMLANFLAGRGLPRDMPAPAR